MHKSRTVERHTQDRLWTRDFVLLLFMSFFNMFCMQFNTTTIAPWVSSLGWPSSYTGLLTLCFTLPSIAGCFIWGRLSQKTGRRVLILAGSLAFGISALAMSWASTALIMVAMLRIVQGVGYSAVNNGMAATQADVIVPERLGEGISFFGIAQSLTLVIGPASALVMVEQLGFASVFNSIAGLCIMVFIFCLLLRVNISASAIRKSETSSNVMDRKSTGGVWLFLEKKSLLPCGLLLLSMTALSSTNFYAATYATNIQAGNASAFFVVYALADVLTIALIGRLSDHIPMQFLVVPGLMIAGAGLLWFSEVQNDMSYFLAAIPVGIGTGLIVPVIQAAAFRGVAKHRRGMASATYYIAFDGGMCLGSLLWGEAIELIGFHSMFRCAAGLLALTAILCVILVIREGKRKNVGTV